MNGAFFCGGRLEYSTLSVDRDEAVVLSRSLPPASLAHAIHRRGDGAAINTGTGAGLFSQDWRIVFMSAGH
jgi:hypothetical protein